MPAFIEDPADEFDFETDWLETVADSGAGGSSFAHEGQESTRVGIIPYNMRRSAARFFLGYAEADTASPWRLRRQQPQWDPDFPWLFAHSVSFSPLVPQANTDNPGDEPYIESLFSSGGNRAAKYKYAVATVKYRAFRCLFLPDSSIASPGDEYRRNVQTTSTAKLEALSADGASFLTFAETAAGGPTVGVSKFPAPVAVLLPKASFVLEWLNVDRAYLTTNANVFFPTKIVNCMGTVNSATFLGFAAGTLLCQPPEFIENPWPVASDTSQDIEYEILKSVTVRLHLDYFEPTAGAGAPATQGHNLMPWRADGKFYLATRDGTATLSKALLEYTDFTQMFTHVSSP